MPYGYCVTSSLAPCNGAATGWGNLIYAARSKHSGGVNAGMADGAVLFFTNDVNALVWQALGSINGGETADANAP